MWLRWKQQWFTVSNDNDIDYWVRFFVSVWAPKKILFTEYSNNFFFYTNTVISWDIDK